MNLWKAMRKRVNEGARVESDLDAEVRAYLDGVIEEKVAGGKSREAARREVLVELAGREQVKEAVRDARAPCHALGGNAALWRAAHRSGDVCRNGVGADVRGCSGLLLAGAGATRVDPLIALRHE